MSLSPSQVVRETHRLALQDHLTSILNTPEEWSRFQSIAQEAAERTDAEKTAFRTEYQFRLEEARQVILRQHSGQFLDHPKPSWAAEAPTEGERLPSADKVDLLARNRVQSDHDRRLQAIRKDEVDGYSAMIRDLRSTTQDRAPDRGRENSQLKEAFNLTRKVSEHERKTRGMSGPSRT